MARSSAILKAFEDYDRAAEVAAANEFVEAWYTLGMADGYSDYSAPERAIPHYDRLIEEFLHAGENGALTILCRAVQGKLKSLSTLGRHDEIVGFSGHIISQLKGDRTTEQQIAIGFALGARTAALFELGLFEDAVGCADQMISRFARNEPPALWEKLDNSIATKAVALIRLERFDDAIRHLRWMLNYYNDTSLASSHPMISGAVTTLQTVLLQLNRFNEIIQLDDWVIGKFADETASDLRDMVLSAFTNKAAALAKLGKYADLLSFAKHGAWCFGEREKNVEDETWKVISEHKAQLIELGKYDDALILVEGILKKIEAEEDKYFILVNIVLEKSNLIGDLGRYEEALKILNSLLSRYKDELELGPVHIIIEIYLSIGGLLTSLSRFDDAIHLYRETIAKYETKTDESVRRVLDTARWSVGDALALANRNEEAIDHYKDLISKLRADRATPSAIAYALLGQAFATGRVKQYEKAVEIYDRILTDFPDYALTDLLPIVCGRKGAALIGINKFENALRPLDESVDVYRASESVRKQHSAVWPLLHKGYALARLARYGEAIDVLDGIVSAFMSFQASSIRAAILWSLYDKAKILQWLGRDEQALAAQRQAIALIESNNSILSEAVRRVPSYRDDLIALKIFTIYNSKMHDEVDLSTNLKSLVDRFGYQAVQFEIDKLIPTSQLQSPIIEGKFTANARLPPLPELRPEQIEAIKQRGQERPWNERPADYVGSPFHWVADNYAEWIPGLSQSDLATADPILHGAFAKRVERDGLPSWLDVPAGPEAKLRRVPAEKIGKLLADREKSKERMRTLRARRKLAASNNTNG